MKLKIFLADVDQVLADLLKASLASHDADIKSVDRGSMALMELKDYTPHLALINANLKGISGYDLCEFIKQDKDLSSTRVVLIDSDEQPLDLEQAEKAGYDAQLRRPFSVDSISVLLEGLGVAEEATEAAESPPGEVFQISGEEADKDSLLRVEEEQKPLESLETDLTEEEAGEQAEPAEPQEDSQAGQAQAGSRKVDLEQVLSNEAGRRIVSEIVSQMSDKVVREVAWEVVPELAEQIVRQTIDQLKKKPQ